MRLALECPTELLEEIQPYADFDFILAHLVLSDPAYSAYYANSSRKKILDNSVNELGTPCTVDEIQAAALEVNPDIVVPPDYLGLVMQTIKSLDICEGVFRPHCEILPVLQGKDEVSVLVCLQFILNRGYDSLAIPYDLTSLKTDKVELMAERRASIVDFLKSRVENIHLLGLDTLEELEFYRNVPQVTSIDTGSPVLHGLLGLEFGKDPLRDKQLPTLDCMPRSAYRDEGKLALVKYNVEYLKNILLRVGG